MECLPFRTSEAVPEDEDRIVGGHEVSPPHKYPFQVNKVNLIMEDNAHFSRCILLRDVTLVLVQVYFILSKVWPNKIHMISVLDSHHILTAAHCVYDPETGNLQEPSDCFIVAGAHTRPGSGAR